MMSFALVAFVVAAAIFAYGLTQRKRTGGKAGKKWATSAAALGLVVMLTQPSGLTVSVDFATAPITATEGVDYEGSSGTVSFAPGEMFKVVDNPGVAAVATIRGHNAAAISRNRRKSAGTKRTSCPAARSPRSTGPKNPLRNCTPRRVKMRKRSLRSALNTTSSSKSSRSPSAMPSGS